MSTDTAILTPEMHERLQGLLDDLFGDFMGGNANGQRRRGAAARGAARTTTRFGAGYSTAGAASPSFTT